MKTLHTILLELSEEYRSRNEAFARKLAVTASALEHQIILLDHFREREVRKKIADEFNRERVMYAHLEACEKAKRLRVALKSLTVLSLPHPERCKN